MTLGGMAFRYLFARRTVAFLTVFSLMLGVALPCMILLLREQAESSLLRDGTGIDMVVGAKGSPLQLVLSVVHHLDLPTGNIPYAYYEQLKGDRRIRNAVPVALGDNVAGFRIVGTTTDFLHWRPRSQEGTAGSLLEQGSPDLNQPFGAVLGSEVARLSGLTLGDQFVGAHGLRAVPGTSHSDFPYQVTGSLKEQGTVVDRLVLTSLKSVWQVHAADEEKHRTLYGVGENVERAPEVTAVLLELRNPGLRMWLREEINRTTGAMAAVPVDELHRLYQRVLRPAQMGMLWISGAVALVSMMAILATLLQSAERRRKDWAVLRALGARPKDIFSLVWLESLWISTIGVVFGVILAHGIPILIKMSSSAAFLTGFSPWKFAEYELMVIGAVWLGATLFGLVPALVSYRRSPLEDLSREQQ